jgi:hypothetical protein
MAEDYPDFMGDIRTWARSVTNDLLDGRVFFKFPTTMKYPAVRIHQAGGGPQSGSEAPIEDVRLVFDIWGSPGGSTPGTFADVTAVVRRLKTQLHALSGPIGSTTHVLDADVTSVVSAVDPDGGSPRMLLTALVTIRIQ